MARKPTVNLTDTFETFRQKTNLISSNVGDPDNLTTPVTTDLVQALNEINGRTTQTYIRNSVSLSASNSALHASMSYNAATGVFSFQSNTITDSDIPALDASKTATGVFNAQRIPGIDASKIVTGVFDSARMPSGYFDKEFLNNTTDDLQEGATNLYYTDQRVYGAVGIYPGDSTLDYNSATGQFRVNITGLGLASGLDSAQTAVIAQGAIDSAYINARVNADSGIALSDLSVSTGSASGGGTLAYNNGTGVFSFSPADLTGSTKIYRQEVNVASASNSASYFWSASNFPTGISRKPDTINARLVCKSAQGGYSIGDEIYVAASYNDHAGLNEGISSVWDNSESRVHITVGNNGLGALTQRTGGSSFFASVNNWSIKLGLVWYGTDANEDVDTLGNATAL